jgi:hypothetical protein
MIHNHESNIAARIEFFTWPLRKLHRDNLEVTALIYEMESGCDNIEKRYTSKHKEAELLNT